MVPCPTRDAFGGCCLHGVFDNQAFREAWLASLGWRPPPSEAPSPPWSAELDRLADVVEASLDMAALDRIIWARQPLYKGLARR